MNKQQIVLNTLVFNQQHLAGESQLNMLQRIVHLGIAQAEVRREFFSDPLKEAPAIKDFVRENHLTPISLHILLRPKPWGFTPSK